MGKLEEEHSAKMVRYIKGVVLGGGVALAVCLVYLVIAAFAISEGWLEMTVIYQVVVVGCVVGSGVGGRWAVQRCGARALVVGLLVGVVHFLLLLSVGVICFGGTPESGGIGLFCACLCGGALSGLLGYKRKSKKKRRK